MNLYEQRISILLKQGVISNKTYLSSMKVFDQWSKKYELDETCTAFIMHVIMCIERAYNNAQLIDEHAKLKEELKQTKGYENCIRELNSLQSLAEVSLNDSEKTYMLMHLLNLHQGGTHGTD